MALTPKQERFVAEYLLDLNATQAAARAGYSAKTAEQQGHQLLKKTSVSAEIQKAMQRRAERVERNADDVLRDIHAVKADAVQVVTDRDGNRVMVDRPAALKALELEGRHYKMFTDKVEHSGNIHLNKSDDELDREIAAKKAALGLP